MLTMLFKYLSSLTTSLRCFYEIPFGLEVDKLLHLSIAIINFFLEKNSMISTVWMRVSLIKTCLLVDFELN